MNQKKLEAIQAEVFKKAMSKLAKVKKAA